ncbi:pre-mRNA cleavage and polyadenylation specificity factor [Encephalitozoon intestinalis]
MNYLYSQESPWNSVEGCSAGFFIPGTHSFLTYNGNIVRLWKYGSGLVLVKQHILFERVCQVEKYRISPDQDGLVFLFHKAKISLVRFDPQENEFKTTSLKFFEKDEFDIKDEDIRNVRIGTDLGMFQMNKRYFSVFPLFPGMFNAKVFKFIDIDGKIKNPIDFTFLENYSIPTVCLVYDSLPKKYTVVRNYNAIVFSIDLSAGKFHTIDEFLVPPKTFKVVCAGSILLFISHNSILIRSTSSSYSVPLNRMSEACEAGKALNDVVLFDVNFFSRGNTCLIFNGNGDRYRLEISMDIKRIIGASLEFERRGSIASCIGEVENLLFVGSIGDSSELFEIKSLRRRTEENVIPAERSVLEEYSKLFGNKDQETQKQDEEYAKLFNEGSESRAGETFTLHQVDEISNIGFLNEVAMKRENEAVFVVEGLEPGVRVVSNIMPLKILKSQKTRRYLYCSRVLDFYILGRAGDTKVFKWPEKSLLEVDGKYAKDMDTLLFAEFGTGIIQITPTFWLGMDHNLKVVGRGDFTSKAAEAKIICSGLFLAVRDSEKRLVFYDREMTVVTCIPNVTCFADIGNKVFILSDDLLSIFDIDKRMGQFPPCSIRGVPYAIRFSSETSVPIDLSEKNDDEAVIEMAMLATGTKILMLFRLKGGYMVAYESFGLEALLRETLPSEVIFFKIHLPRHIAFNLSPETKAFYNVGTMVFIKATTNVFMVPTDKGHFLYRSQYTLNSIAMDGDDVIQLSKGYLMVCRVPSIENGYVFGSGFIGKKIPVLRTPKHIEYADRYMVVASCEEVEFSPKNGKDCGVPVNTYRFYVDLYSEKYEHISTYELEENEYVFDIQYLVLDDMQGNYGKSPFLLVCTTFIEGEDRPAKGRLHVLEIISVVPSLESPFKDCKLKVLGIEKTKGSIVQCSEVRGKIVLCLGTKIMIYKIDRGSGIIPIGFHDLHTFTSSISVVKNYILASDIYRGLSFFFFQSKPIRLHLISSSEPLKNATSTELLITGNELSMVCCDIKGTIHAYTYSPNNIISMDGAKLVKRVEMKTNLGRLSSSRVGFRKNSIMLYSRSNQLVHVNGVDNSSYLKLLGIQTSIMGCFKAVFGLNPRDYLNSDIHLHSLSLKSPIVLHILNLFSYFDLSIQESISSSVVMSRREILDIIASLNQS